MILRFSYRPKKTDGGVDVISPETLQSVGSQATRILNKVQEFFSYNLIENYGCDYSSSGLTLEALGSKVKAFLQRTTSDGPRYDTYVIYYSGPVHTNGDWALPRH